MSPYSVLSGWLYFEHLQRQVSLFDANTQLGDSLSVHQLELTYQQAYSPAEQLAAVFSFSFYFNLNERIFTVTQPSQPAQASLYTPGLPVYFPVSSNVHHHGWWSKEAYKVRWPKIESTATTWNCASSYTSWKPTELKVPGEYHDRSLMPFSNWREKAG